MRPATWISVWSVGTLLPGLLPFYTVTTTVPHLPTTGAEHTLPRFPLFLPMPACYATTVLEILTDTGTALHCNGSQHAATISLPSLYYSSLLGEGWDFIPTYLCPIHSCPTGGTVLYTRAGHAPTQPTVGDIP